MSDPKLDHSRPFTLTVASHRRSGTHLLIEYLRRNFSVANPNKTHNFPEYLPDSRLFIHVVRNPWDTLWATWRWFSTAKCGNDEIAKRLQKFTFEEWIRGRAGGEFGFRDLQVGNRDSLRVSRGMFYDPVAYWVAHTDAWLARQREGKLLSVRYEHLVRDPQGVMASVAAYLREPMSGAGVITVGTGEGVGHAPEKNPIGYSAPNWPTDLRALLLDQAGELLAASGYDDDAVPGVERYSLGRQTVFTTPT